MSVKVRDGVGLHDAIRRRLWFSVRVSSAQLSSALTPGHATTGPGNDEGSARSLKPGAWSPLQTPLLSRTPAGASESAPAAAQQASGSGLRAPGSERDESSLLSGPVAWSLEPASRARIKRSRPDQLAGSPLLIDVAEPAYDAADCKRRREELAIEPDRVE